MSNYDELLNVQQIATELSDELDLKKIPDEIDILRYACRKYFISFCIAVGMPDGTPFVPTRFHQLLADKLQSAYERVKTGKDVRMIVEVPPQHGKSSMVSELFPAWIMGQESWPVICASYGASLAEVKSKHTRDIVTSDTYQYIFPDAGLSMDSTSKALWTNRKKAMYKAVGRGAGLTGTPGKVMIADDLIADKSEANSETIRESAWDWWNTVFYTRKQQGSFICLVETRWHLDDPAGKLEEQQKQNKGKRVGSYDEWERLTFPAIAEDDEYIDGVLFRKAGEALCPERFNLDTLEKTKNAYIGAGKVGDWAALYQQNPIISENAKFRRQWFKYYEEKDLVGKKLYYTTTVDLAISQKKEADNTVIRTVAKEVDGSNWYLMEETAGRMDPLQTIDAIFHHHSLYRSKIYIESVAYQAALQYFVVEEQRKRQQYFQIEEIKPTKLAKKEDRIEGLQPLYRSGVIFHRKGQDENLEMELMQFPKGRHDDRADALSYHLQVVRHAPRQQSGQATSSSPLNWKTKKAVDKFDPHKPFGTV